MIVCVDVRMYSVSGGDVCCSVVFDTLVGVFVFSVIYNIFIHVYKYIAYKMCIVLNMVHK